jgi:predicted DNA-binding transcriptional regulator YafY
MDTLDSKIISVLPNANGNAEFLSTPDVHKKLEVIESDAPVVKTVQRRLEKLQRLGFVEMKKRGAAWLWCKGAGAGGMAGKSGAIMTREEALALHMLRSFTSRQIPTLVAEALSDLFKVADKRLEMAVTEDERRYGRWADKVAVEHSGFALRYPPIDPETFATISQALFHERKLEIVYRPRSNVTNDKCKVILPLGLVEVGGLVYLIGGTEGRSNPTMYRLDRLARAAMTVESFSYPRSFKLDDYVRQQRQFDFMVEGEVMLKLRFFNGAGDHLLETPFAADQETRPTSAGLEVQGTVLLSQRLRWWLRSFGPYVEVMAPEKLRVELAEEAQALAKLYRC